MSNRRGVTAESRQLRAPTRPPAGTPCAWKDDPRQEGLIASYHALACNGIATSGRPTWRFGIAEKGEPLIVDTRLWLCRRCLTVYDESQIEAAIEARMS